MFQTNLTKKVMQHIIHDSGGKNLTLFVTKGWASDSTIFEVDGQSASNSSAYLNTRLGYIHRRKEMLALVVLAFDLSEQGDYHMLFWVSLTAEF
jgi:hypothetical protein